MPGGPVRFLVAKPGLDGHSNGAEQIAVRVKRLLVRRSLWIDDDDGGRPADTEEPPALADLYQTNTGPVASLANGLVKDTVGRVSKAIPAVGARRYEPP